MTKFDALSARFSGGNPPDLKVGVVAGAAANTPIAFPGITKDDIIVGAVALTGAAHTHVENTAAAYTQNAVTGAASATALATADRLAAVSIPSDGNVQFSVATTGESLLIFYWELS